jgi:phage/plasmid-associated DNA primase
MSEVLPVLFEHVLGKIKGKLETADVDNAPYYKGVHRNFKMTMRKLGDKNFINNSLALAEAKFFRCGFSKKLDQKPLIRGVANGVLKLLSGPSLRPVLINGYHSHPVSKYTEAPYIPFNPRDPQTKKLLYVLRNLWPDDEKDSHQWFMMFLASTVDGNPKESIFVIAPGGGSNGKSFVVELHKGAIGNIYSVQLPIEYLTTKSHNADNATPVLMMLKDATLATYSESDKHDKLNTSRVKSVTGQEHVAGRKLHQDLVQFKPRAHHLVTTNFDFDITTNDWGIWRRVKRVRFKITFIDTSAKGSQIKFDPTNKYHREADPDVSDKWTSDPEIVGRYLGFLVYMHYWLYRKYRGKVMKVPHPHIQFDTAKYRIEQNAVEKFIQQKMVTLADPEAETPMSEQVQIYQNWHARENGGDKIAAKGLSDMFLQSSMKNHIKTTGRGYFMVGHRFLPGTEDPGEDEKFAQDEVHTYLPPTDNFGVPNQTVDEYYAEICAEYDTVAHLFQTGPEFDYRADALVDHHVVGSRASEYAEKYRRGEIDLTAPRYEMKGRDPNVAGDTVLPSGIRLHLMDEPTKNSLTGEYSGMCGFLPMDEEIFADADQVGGAGQEVPDDPDFDPAAASEASYGGLAGFLGFK